MGTPLNILGPTNPCGGPISLDRGNSKHDPELFLDQVNRPLVRNPLRKQGIQPGPRLGMVHNLKMNSPGRLGPRAHLNPRSRSVRENHYRSLGAENLCDCLLDLSVRPAPGNNVRDQTGIIW